MGKKFKRTRIIYAFCYAIFFAVYLIIGFQPAIADASSYKIDGRLEISSVNIDSDVTALTLTDNKLHTPDDIVGSYSKNPNKTILIGHSTTVFESLKDLKIAEIITYNDENYIVEAIETLEKSDISMKNLLKSEQKKTIILMTCAGTLLSDGDATERLIIKATLM